MEQKISSPVHTGTKSLFPALLVAGFIVGLLDALAASVSSYFPKGITPDKVFRYVASGVFGKDAFAGGVPTALAGLFFHFVIAYGWTTLFFLAYPRVKLLSENKYIVGMLYGVFVLLSMNLVVVPLSNVPSPNPGTVQVQQLFIHMFLVGLPISLLANRYYSKQDL
ncbi:MAG TPA: hypothetical protein VGK39_08590 [Cyclobacteriaceae bacterium]